MKTLAMFLILTSCFQAFASTDRGNGGYSHVCRDNKGPILNAELLDIYEGKLLFKRTYPTNMKSYDELLNATIAKLKFYPAFLEKVQKEIAKINANSIFIPEGHELEFTEDAFPAFKKKGCEFEQLANYTESGEVIISQEIYDQLDTLNRVGLTLHEAIYTIRRKSLGEETSQSTRKLVAHLLASNGDQAIIERMSYDSLYRLNQRKKPCGLNGTLDERIENCSYLEKSEYNMVLVTRTQELKEVWLDRGSRLLWSDRLAGFYSAASAVEACENASVPEMAFLSEYTWRLPSQADYQSNQNFHYALPNMNTWFWTSTERGRSVVTYSGSDGTLNMRLFRNSRTGSARCVSYLK